MMERSTRIGAVLAGGRSQRMGRDKARLTVSFASLAESGPDSEPEPPSESENPTWIERSLGLLQPHVAESWVIGRDVTSEDCPHLGTLPRSCMDRRPDAGPLGGIETALELAGRREVLVVACDMPALTPEVVGRLLDTAAESPSAPALAFREEESTDAEPRLAGLLLLVRTTALSVLRASLDRRERRLQRFLREVGTRWIVADEPVRRALWNVNTPGDLGAGSDRSR